MSIIATLAGLYGLFLLYLGITPILQTPDDKKNTFMLFLFINHCGLHINFLYTECVDNQTLFLYIE